MRARSIQKSPSLVRRHERFPVRVKAAIRNLRVSPHRASAGRTRQNQDSQCRGSCPRVCSVAGAPTVPPIAPGRFHAWRRLQHACALDDQSSCPRTSPHRLTPPEVRAIKDMVTALDYRHAPTGTLAVLAQRLGKVWASPSTWYPSRAEVRLAPPSAPRAHGEAEGGPSSGNIRVARRLDGERRARSQRQR
jgi:hypothetical protein